MAYRIVASKPGGVEVLQKQEIDIPQPADGEVLLRHTAIGVNFIDTYFRSGLYPWPADHDLILGSEAAGVVEAVGPGVDGFSAGDRVAYTVAHGSYATHRTIAASHLVKVPEGVPDEIAAGAFLKGLTARYLLHDSFALTSDHQVLFHAAAGGVGMIAGQWMAAMGVKPVGTAGGPEKCARALENGYAHMIDYRSEDFIERFREIHPEGAHVVYDSVGKGHLSRFAEMSAEPRNVCQFRAIIRRGQRFQACRSCRRILPRDPPDPVSFHSASRMA